VELDDAASDTQAASESRMDGPRRTILLVDDDSAVREVTSTLLQELGYSVIEAQNGFAALAVIERTAKIDLLLADFAMPGMNGAELARTLRQRQPDLPVVFITGYAELGELDEQEYFIVPKPFRENDLANKVHSALKGSNPLKVIQQT
jgi:CheY-like chemotaxis protein